MADLTKKKLHPGANPKSENLLKGTSKTRNPKALPDKRFVTMGEAYELLSKATNAKPALVKKFLAEYGKYGPRNISYLARQCGVHRNTAVRWIKLLEDAEVGFYKPLNANVIPLTDIASEDEINAGRLKAEHIERIIDRYIAKAAEDGDQQGLIALVTAKDKVRSLREDTPVVDVDIERRLGPAGLAGIDKKLATQIALLAKHADQLPLTAAALRNLATTNISPPSEAPALGGDCNAESPGIED